MADADRPGTEPPDGDAPPDPWAEADRAWTQPPDRWAEADRRWNRADEAAREFRPPGAARGERPPPSPSRGVAASYTDAMSTAGPYLGLGAQIAGAMIGFVGLGVLVDRWAGTGPWGVIGGAVLGLLGVMALVIRLSVEASAKDPKRTDRPV